MNKYVMTSLLALVAGFGIHATAGTTPELVESVFHTGYLPDGFDTNDNVQVVAEGLFSNSCYRPAGVQVEVDHELKHVSVTSTAYYYDGMCLQMIVPFSQTIDLGLMKTGTYKVTQGFNELGSLNIRLATNSTPDDYLYAPVTQAYLETVNGKNLVTVTGNFTSSCMRLTDVMVHVQPKVIVVQPIAEVSGTGAGCTNGDFPFKKSIELGSIPQGRYLIHVRSLNGKAINNLVDVR